MPPHSDLLDRLPPEGVLLMLCAGPDAQDPAIAELARRRDIDWALVLFLAERERATSVVWRRINRLEPSAIPAAVRPDFQRRAMIADFTAAYLEQRAGETLVRLAAAGIESVLLKGAALATTAFGGFVNRPMGDVDLLLDERRVEEGWRVARKCGWIWDEEQYPLSHYVGHHHLPPLVGRAGTDVKLEIHAALFVRGHPFSLTYADMLEGARPVAVGPGTALVPRREALLLHGAMHYAWSHLMSFGGWRALRDTAALVPLTDWGLFERMAQENRAGSVAYWTLRLSRDLVGAAVPRDVLERLSRAMDLRGSDIVARHFARDMLPLEGGCPSHRLRRMLWVRAMQPARMHHGGIRPWALDDSLRAGDEEALVGAGILRVARPVQRVRAWWSYGRTLLGRGTPRSVIAVGR